MNLSLSAALQSICALPKKKPRYSATQLKEYWAKKNYTWTEATETKPAELKTDCPCCKGEGTFGQYKRTCFRCKGKGHMDMDDHRRWEVRQSHIKSGTSTVTYHDFEKKNGGNHWG